MNTGGNKENCTQPFSNKNSTSVNTYGGHTGHTSNTLREPYQQHNRKPMLPNNRCSYQEVLWY